MPEGVAGCVRPAVEELINRSDFSPFSMRTEMQAIMERCFKESGGFPGAPGEFPGGYEGHPSGFKQEELTAVKEQCIQRNFDIAVLTKVQVAMETGEQLDSTLAQEIKEKCSFEVRSSGQYESLPSDSFPKPPAGGGTGFNFPPQVTACLESKGVLQQLTSLQGRPSPEIESQIQICFQESFKQESSEQHSDLPPDVNASDFSEGFQKEYDAQYQQQFEQQYQEGVQHQQQEQFQQQYEPQYQQQFEQQYQQEFQGQFEQQYQEPVHEESQTTEERQSRIPTIPELLLGFISVLVRGN